MGAGLPIGRPTLADACRYLAKILLTALQMQSMVLASDVNY